MRARLPDAFCPGETPILPPSFVRGFRQIKITLQRFRFLFALCFTVRAGGRDWTMKGCTVSVVGGDGQTHMVEVKASSLFDAVDQAAQQWARLWWYYGNDVVEVEVESSGRCWRVRLERVRQWRGGARKAR